MMIKPLLDLFHVNTENLLINGHMLKPGQY